MSNDNNLNSQLEKVKNEIERFYGPSFFQVNPNPAKSHSLILEKEIPDRYHITITAVEESSKVAFQVIVSRRHHKNPDREKMVKEHNGVDWYGVIGILKNIFL
ncbi:MAG: hypothetical protein ACKVQC_07065 [Elusimicrobiota bacterium]